MAYTSGPAIDNLNAVLRDIGLRIVAESGGRVTIGSGWRSSAQQQDLYNRWISGNYNVPVVARPGTSKHEHGLAIDFDGDLALAQKLGRKYGLIFPVKGEAWHAQLGEGVMAQAGGQGGFQGGIQYDLNYTGPDPIDSPENVLANRLHAVMSIVGLNPIDAGPDMDVMDPAMLDVLDQTPQIKAPTSIPEAGARMDEAQDPYAFTANMDRVPMVTGAGAGEDHTQVQFGSGSKADLQRYAYSRLAEFGMKPEDMQALITLWDKESGWNPLAQNPTSTAFGIAQFLNGTWAGTGFKKTTDPRQQIDAGLTYIRSRYGNPRNALQFHLQNNWY